MGHSHLGVGSPRICGDLFQDPQLLPETASSTEPYIDHVLPCPYIPEKRRGGSQEEDRGRGETTVNDLQLGEKKKKVLVLKREEQKKCCPFGISEVFCGFIDIGIRIFFPE